MIRRVSTILIAVVLGTLTAAAPASATTGLLNIHPMGEVHCC
ncbi:MAG TPA: hypothetical protein VHE57_15050 [Mycobacteriales bacterium]|nr:hypothetical protein [Mycobacteriales bacterium]